jgi:hypothetical protein
VSTDAGGNAPLVTYSYDQQGSTCPSSNVSYPVGRLCQEQFSSNGVTGSYTYAYDLRGRTYDTTFTTSALAGSYSLSASYDDADRVTQLNYPAAGNLSAEFLSLNYDNPDGGGLATVSSNFSSPTTLLAHNLTYAVQGWLTGWQSGSDAPQQAGFVQSQDGDGRLANRQLTGTPQGGQTANVAQVQPTYDAAGNVATLTTSFAAIPGVAGTGGNETQAFCYDAQDRLVWASTQAIGSCGTVGSEGISGAGYTATWNVKGCLCRPHVSADVGRKRPNAIAPCAGRPPRVSL